jgi:hypothetical protein
MVDDIQGFAVHLPTVGVEVLKPPTPVPTGHRDRGERPAADIETPAR